MTRRAALVSILLVSAFLRLENLGAIEHNIDQAYPIYQALRTLEHGALPLTGQQTSVLFANPALTGYLYIPALWIGRSPALAMLWVVLVNTLAVALAYRAARALLGAERALIAAGLLAINPWVVEYSRTTWVQSLVPFFACLTAFWLWPVLAGRSARPGRDTLAALVSMTLLTQTYLPAFAIVLPAAALLILYRRRVPWRAALAGGLVFFMATGMYAAGLLADGAQTRAKLARFLQSDDEARLSAEAWQHAARMVTGADYAAARGSGAPIQDAAQRQALSGAASAALALALGAGVLLRLRKDPLLIIWLAAPLLLMSWVSRPVHPFYTLVTLPAGQALAAVGLGPLLRRRWGKVTLAAGGVILTMLFGINSARFYQQTGGHPGDFGLGALPLREGVRLGAAINSALEAKRFLSVDETPEAISSFCGRLTGVSRDQRFPALTRILPWPGGVTVVFVPRDTKAVAQPWGAEQVRVLALRDGTAIRIYRHEHAGGDVAAWLPADAHRVEQPTDRGLTLVGWVWERDALLTFWRVDALPPDHAAWLLGPAIQAFNATGERVAVYSGEAVSGEDWRVGQLYVQRVAVSGGRSNAATFQITLYDALRNQNAVFVQTGNVFYQIKGAILR